MVSRARFRFRRLLGMLLCLGVLASLLDPSGVSAAAAGAAARTSAAVAGQGPLSVVVPATSLPYHGYRSAGQVPIDPPRLKVDDSRRGAVASPRDGGGGGGGGTGPSATNLHLLPGLVVGDTSLLLYFDAPDTGWTSAQVDLYADSDHNTILHSAPFTFAQAVVCRAPAKFCFTLDNADGWGLVDGTAYVVKITLTATDGTTQTSGFSPAGTARALPKPAPVDPGQVTSNPGAGSNGVTDSQPMIRGAGVNTATGAFTQHAVDAAMSSSYAINVQAERSYSSLDQTPGLMGVGWSFSYQARIFPKPGQAGAEVFKAEDGTETIYTLQADGSYAAPAGALSKLEKAAGGGWTVSTPTKQKLSFDAGGKLLSKLDERGKGVTLGYDGGGNLATVTDAGGRVLAVTVSGGLLTQLALPDGRSVKYTYSAGRLASVRDAGGDVTSFGYDGSGRLATLTDALGHLQLTTLYDATTGRVSQQVDHFNKATTFTWDPGKQQSVVTDPDGAVFTDGYLGNVLQYSQNGNGDVSQFRADSSLNVGVEQDADGSQYVMTHDANGNVTSRTLVDAGPNPVAASEGSVYDANSNLTAFTDANNHTTHYTYNQFSQLISVTDALGNTSHLDYDGSTGLLVKVTDTLGNATTYAYDGAGDKVSQTDPLGNVTRFAYDATGRVTSAIDARGSTSTSAYDREDRLVKSVDALEHTQLWSYDNAGRLHSYTDGNGFMSNFVYNDGNQLTQKIDADLRTTGYTYTPGGRTASVKDGVGDTTTYGYNTAGEVRTVTSPRGNVSGANASQFTTTYFYDFKGNVTQEQTPDPNGGTDTTQYTYDTMNHLVAVQDPLGRTTITGYDAAGNRVFALDPLKNEQQWQYDADNRVSAVIDPLGNTATSTYDAAGRVLTHTTALGETTKFSYDAAGRLVSETSPRGNTTTLVYDAVGNRTSVTDPLGDTATATYDADNNVIQRTDPNGHSTTYTYDADNRLITIQGPDATKARQVTTNGYDHAGNLITRVDPLGSISRYTYDAAGRLASSVDPLGRIRRYSYDPDGKLTNLLTARATQSADPAVRAANTITQKYDSRDRLTERDLGTGGAVYTYGYNADGEKTSLGSPAGTESRAYDDDGRLIGDTTAAGAFAYGYDAASNLTSRTLPDGSSQSLGYDKDNQPVSLTVPAGTATYAYDADGNLTGSMLPGGGAQQRTYDQADRLASLSDTAPGGQVLSSYTLTRDAVGNPVRLDTTQAGSSRSDAFTYDAANRLTAMCFQVTTCPASGNKSKKSPNLTFTYDLVGNRLTKTAPGIGPGQGGHTEHYHYDAADELTKITGNPGQPTFFSYDADGNQVEAKTQGRAKSDVVSTFDLDNQLVSVDDGTQKTVYTQDAAGDRAAADTTPDKGGATTHTSYLWDVNNPLPMLDAEQSGTSAGRAYTYNPSGSPLTLAVGGGSFVYQPDPFGSTAELTDLTGAVQQQFTMNDPFGGFDQSTPGGAAAPAARLGFQGQYNDPLSGAYHLRARDYATDRGQFHSVDPVTQVSSRPAQSTYVYANDNPLTGSDPSGLGCGWFSVVCNAASQVVSTVSSAVSTVADAVTSAAQTVAQDVSSVVQEGVNLAKQAASDVQQAATQVVNTATSAAKTVVHAASDAYHATATWVDKHKAQIASIAVAIAVGAACEALTAGAGTIGCAALAGAAGSMVEYGLSTPSNQLSLGGFLKAGLIGGVTGALGGAGGVILGRVGGAVLDNVAGGIMSRIGSGAAEDIGADAAATAGGEAVGSTAGKLAGEETAADTVETAAVSDSVSEGEGAALSCPASFAAGTPVLMADGSQKPIDKLQVGDLVQAKDPASGQVKAERVDATFDHKNPEGWVALQVGGETIDVTAEHPFWVASKHRFVPAGQLKVGDQLELSDGSVASVAAAKPFSSLADHYNLTVHELHTYFAGSLSVLVHNCDTTVLYHGSPDFQGSEFSLSTAQAGTRAATGRPGVYLTDDPQRAITQFATPTGKVVRVEVPTTFANAIRQVDKFGRTEYFVGSEEGVQTLNRGITDIVSQRDAILRYFAGNF